MKRKVLDYCMKVIQDNKKLDDEKLAEIRYGLEGLYLTITKIIVISIIAIILNLFKELIIFLFLYNIIRMPSFGLHATKSWICLLSSSIVFILVPYLCTILKLNSVSILITGIILTLLFFKNAPADTEKRPIINKKRRLIFKLSSVSISIIFTIIALIVNNTFLQNALILSLIVQCFMISPLVYKIFNLKYDNYKTYLQSI